MRCLFYALGKWRREGGYLMLCRSNYGPFPHFLHLSRDRTTLSHYAPKDGYDTSSPPLWFDGEVKHDDL